jgi:transcriptional regulator with XRE-family HTH domain
MSTAAQSDHRTALTVAVAEEIRATLARRRMSASALARELGKSQTYVWRRLSGETAFDTDDLESIAAVLRVAVVDLLPQSIREVNRVKARKREQPERPVVVDPVVPSGRDPIGLAPAGDGSSVAPSGTRRPRRLALSASPMSEAHAVAA